MAPSWLSGRRVSSTTRPSSCNDARGGDRRVRVRAHSLLLFAAKWIKTADGGSREATTPDRLTG